MISHINPLISGFDLEAKRRPFWYSIVKIGSSNSNGVILFSFCFYVKMGVLRKQNILPTTATNSGTLSGWDIQQRLKRPRNI